MKRGRVNVWNEETNCIVRALNRLLTHNNELETVIDSQQEQIKELQDEIQAYRRQYGPLDPNCVIRGEG